MHFLDPNHDDLKALPAGLRVLLEAELAAGNAIAEISHGFPAPPCGACFKMARTIATPPGAEVKPDSWPAWNGCSGFTDEKGHFILMNPPEPGPPQLTMDEIRERMNVPVRTEAPKAVTFPPDLEKSARAGRGMSRFEESMNIDYEKWREGTGYDLEALKEASEAEKVRIENKLLSKSPKDWRDIEALARMDTPRAHAALRKLLEGGRAEERMAVIRYAPKVVTDDSRRDSLVEALRSAVIYGGLTQALDEVQAFHPPEVMRELRRGPLQREGEVAVHFAAMLFYLHGKADEPFDWNHRPFFLRFHTENPDERHTAYLELCAILGMEAEPESRK